MADTEKQSSEKEPSQPEGILETCIYSNNLASSKSFYSSILGLELQSEKEGRHLFYRCGNQMLLIFNPASTSEPDGSAPPHGASGPGHLAFRVREDDLELWREKLESHGVPIESESEWPRGGRSFYFRDPDGNSIEIAVARIWGLAPE